MKQSHEEVCLRGKGKWHYSFAQTGQRSRQYHKQLENSTLESHQVIGWSPYKTQGRWPPSQPKEGSIRGSCVEMFRREEAPHHRPCLLVSWLKVLDSRKLRNMYLWFNITRNLWDYHERWVLRGGAAVTGEWDIEGLCQEWLGGDYML